MAASANRTLITLAGDDLVAKLVVLNDAVCYAGTMVAIDYASEIQPAANTAGFFVVGYNELKEDNSADGDSIECKRGIVRMDNSSSYPIARTAIGTVCYVEDDQTVAGYASNMVAAGIVHDVDSSGVWVDMTSLALAYARNFRNDLQVDKTDNYTTTAALCYEGRTYFSCAKAGGMEITLPTAVAGYRVGVKRANATATWDVTIQAATGDTIEASDGDCAAGKQIDNTVDAISGILWLTAVDATHWKVDRAHMPADFSSWVINNA